VNDPHVESLVYHLETDKTLVFQTPQALDIDTPQFGLHLEDGRLTLAMKSHHASIKEARQAVQPFLDAWEIEWALRVHGTREMRFIYETAHLVDRRPPPPGTTIIDAGVADMMYVGSEVAVVLSVPAYPPPPTAFKISPDVEMLWRRYEQYVQGREPLASMAYACFTFITKVIANGERDASARFNIGRNVLDEFGRLTGRKGERKYPSEGPYSGQEESWLTTAIRRLILRIGEEAAGAPLKQIAMTDLPRLDP
jgi:hypothetical protein